MTSLIEVLIALEEGKKPERVCGKENVLRSGYTFVRVELDETDKRWFLPDPLNLTPHEIPYLMQFAHKLAFVAKKHELLLVDEDEAFKCGWKAQLDKQLVSNIGCHTTLLTSAVGSVERVGDELFNYLFTLPAPPSEVHRLPALTEFHWALSTYDGQKFIGSPPGAFYREARIRWKHFRGALDLVDMWLERLQTRHRYGDWERDSLSELLGCDVKALAGVGEAVAATVHDPGEEWCRAMPQTRMMALAGYTSYKTWKSYAKTLCIRRAGNRCLSSIRIDLLDSEDQKASFRNERP